jgi:hypothetical protein
LIILSELFRKYGYFIDPFSLFIFRKIYLQEKEVEKQKNERLEKVFTDMLDELRQLDREKELGDIELKKDIVGLESKIRTLNEKFSHTNGESGIIDNKIKMRKDQKVHQKYKFDMQVEDLKKQMEVERKKLALTEASYNSFLNQVDIIKKRINLQDGDDDKSDDASPSRSPIRSKTTKKTVKNDNNPIRSTTRLVPEGEEMNVIKVEKGANPVKKKGKKKKALGPARSKKENKAKEENEQELPPNEVKEGEKIEVKPGSKVQVDRAKSAEGKRGKSKTKGEANGKKNASASGDESSPDKKPVKKIEEVKETKANSKKN